MTEYSKDIILSSNLSLKRNIKGYDFPNTITFDDSLVIIDIFRNIFGDKLLLLEDLDKETIDKLIDLKILSTKAPDKLVKIGLVFESDTTLVINDSDHLSINISNFGTDIKNAFMKANEIEKVLDEHIDFAFSPELGYLTSKARNTGSGLEIWLNMFLFALIDNNKTYYAFKQAMAYIGIYASKYKQANFKTYANDIYLLKNYGNYRDDLYKYLDDIEDNLITIVKNEEKFRKDYKSLNNIDDKEVEEDIEIINHNLRSGLIKSFEKMIESLYALKKYKILGYDTKLDYKEIDYLIRNISKNEYKGNFNESRFSFLREFLGEDYGK